MSINQLFNKIAPSYDRLNHILSFGMDYSWRNMLARSLKPSEKVLDVAIGTGDLSWAILKKKRAKQITGVDISTEMLAIGKQKFPEKPIDWLEVSVLDMPFADNSFDAVVCAYGVRNFSDLNKGLQEMYRVLKPNGQLRILEFSMPQNKLVRGVYSLYFSRLMPLVGGWLSGDKQAYEYLFESVNRFLTPEQMQETLQHIGFENVMYKPLTAGVTTLYYATKN